MDSNQLEVFEEISIEFSQDVVTAEFQSLSLALVGGGCGDVVFF